MTIRNIVFDLGGVLVDWNPRYLFEKVYETQEEVDWFLENICTNEWNAQQDAGRTLVEATQVLLDQHPEHSAAIISYYERWTEMLNGHIQGTVDILMKLRTNDSHRLLALTNWSGETFPTALEMFEFLHWFEGIVVSGDEKLIKPDQKIYQVLFDRYQIEPGESVFIDDSYKNIEAARELGMHGIHFQSPEQLKVEMQGMGIL